MVPADPERWTLRPFEGLAGGGSVVGRGALDAKGIAVTHLLTLVNLKRRGIVLDRDVIALAVPDEETGGRAGAAAIIRDRRELLRNAEFALTEGGSILPARAGSAEVWGVVFTEKSPCWLRLRTAGIGGHGSTAPPDSAVHRLIAALERVRGIAPEMRVVPEVAQMFSALAPLAGLEDREGYATLGTALALDDAFRERFLADPARAALVHTPW